MYPLLSRKGFSMFHRPAAAASCLLAMIAAMPALAIDGHRVWHDGREIDVVDREGWALYQGDIIVGRTVEVLERSLREGPDGKRIGLAAKSSSLGGAGGTGRYRGGADGSTGRGQRRLGNHRLARP